MDERSSIRTLDADMARLADGDRDACARVFAALWPVMVAFAEKTLGASADADDVAQKAMAKLFAQASDFDRDRPALAWALSITGWECRTVLRQRQRRREDVLTQDVHDGVASRDRDPEEHAVLRGLSEAVRTSLGELSVLDQETLRAAFFEEMGVGAEGSTFRKRKERALDRLRATWRRLYGD
ncbi:RNA polymerase sigma-70 factor, ECF subfamily [Labilithrix luteola]|uniref:RNA polymerase sigma-70 factor, ECF subfamily n=1 Tax=Labilithrix luteola TaxID=1391654 RepID=A0A0K1PZQ9_9BACT|nr:sigma-70 family RNA polymerase sigma factor [Labilithrix luteola]AKU99020.1 RNA polymerase sigma-70 factor, ECF subfamily [Labilithrix luteola]